MTSISIEQMPDLTLIAPDRPGCDGPHRGARCPNEAVCRIVFSRPCSRHPAYNACIQHRDLTLNGRAATSMNCYCHICGPRVLIGWLVRIEPL